MSYSSKRIKRDADQKPIPQYFNPNTDDYEALQGKNGAYNVNVLESALPAGAATDAKLDLILSKLEDVESELTAIKSTNGIKKIEDTVAVQLTGSNVEPAVDFTLSRDVVVTAGSSVVVYSNVDLSKYTHVSGVFVMHSITWPHKIYLAWRNSRDSTPVLQEVTEIGDAHKIFAPVPVVAQRANVLVRNGDTVDRKIFTLDIYGHIRG